MFYPSSFVLEKYVNTVSWLGNPNSWYITNVPITSNFGDNVFAIKIVLCVVCNCCYQDQLCFILHNNNLHELFWFFRKRTKYNDVSPCILMRRYKIATCNDLLTCCVEKALRDYKIARCSYLIVTHQYFIITCNNYLWCINYFFYGKPWLDIGTCH